MKFSVKKRLKRYYFKVQIEFFKRPADYLLLLAVAFGIYMKFDFESNKNLPHRTPADAEKFYKNYYDYVE